MKIDTELWGDIPNCNGLYQVSNCGRVRSWTKQGNRNQTKSGIPKIINPTKGNNGYYRHYIFLSELGKHKNYLIHRMVAKIFLPNPNNFLLVLHKDDVKTNNCVSNLEWGDYIKNNRDSIIRKKKILAKGVARKKSNLTEKDVMDIFLSKDTCAELSKKYSVDNTSISAIRSGKSWNHVTGVLCTRKIRPKYSTDISFTEILNQ